MNDKHTKGPWVIHPNGGQIISTKQPVSICNTFEATQTDPRWRAEHQANAKLLAAAPQLLEALRKIANAGASDLVQYVQEVDGIATETLAILDFDL